MRIVAHTSEPGGFASGSGRRVGEERVGTDPWEGNGMNGKVYLVGAGPGDPDLLTVKALRLLRTADVVLHDDLVTAEILKLISPTAEVRNVGKRRGSKTIRQEEINFLMVTQAASGRH